MVSLERVVSEVLGTMTAANHAFRTLAGLVLHHLLPADFHSALVIAVDRLHRTTAHMTVVLDTGEIDVAEFTALTAVGAEIADVVFVSQSGHALLTMQMTRDGIQCAAQ